MQRRIGSALGAGLAVMFSGCAAPRHLMTELERGHVAGEGPMEVIKLDGRPDSVLRQKAQAVDPTDPALGALIERMRLTLEQSGGVGIAAPQVGLSRRIVLVRHGTRPAGTPQHVEVYLNPAIDWSSPESEDDYEACLSVDGGGALVPRARSVKLSFDRPGSGRTTIDVADWDARIVQPEWDHLDGVLFIDRVKGPLIPIDEMRRLRDEGHRKRGWLPPLPPEPAPVPPS